VTFEAHNGGIDIRGAKVTGAERDFASFASLGGVTLIATGGGIDLAPDGVFPTLLSSTREGIAVIADGSLESNATMVRSAEDVQLSAKEALVLQRAAVSAERDIRLLSAGEIMIGQSVMSAASDIRAESAALTVASNAERRSEIVADDGAVLLRTTAGAIRNQGSLIEGRRASLSDLEAASAVTVSAATDVINESLGNDRLAVFFGRAGDLSVAAGGRIENLTGRLFSNADVVLSAGEAVVSRTVMTGNARKVVMSSHGDRSWRTLWLKEEKIRTFRTHYGDAAIPDEQALITAIGDVAITAPAVVSSGGQINGNAVTISARESIKIESLATGDVRFSETCDLFGCHATGSASTGLLPGTIVAADKLTLRSDGEIHNTGGRLIGGEGLEIDAARVRSDSLALPFVVLRPSGLSGLFQGQYGWVGYNWDGGFLSAPSGKIVVASRQPAELIGTETFAADGVGIDNAGTISNQAGAAPQFLSHIGLFGGGAL